jgi:ABC-2 type transport system permease protein
MAGQLQAEWIKTRSLRSTWAIVALSIVAVVAQAITALVTGGSSDHAITLGVMSGSTLTLVLMVVIGAMITASEYSQKSIITTYTTTPERLRPLLAKALVIAAIALAIGLVSVPLSRVIAAIWYAFGSGSWDAGLGTAVHYDYGIVLAYAGFGIYGVMIGVLCRSTAIGVGIAFAALFVVDPLLAGLTRYSEYSFTAVAGALLDPDVHMSSQPRFGAAIALLVLYALTLGAVAIAIERRRDVG